MLFAVVGLQQERHRQIGPFVRPVTKGCAGYTNENSLFIYDNDLYQYVYNTSRHSFRIQNISQSRYMACMLETAPWSTDTSR